MKAFLLCCFVFVIAFTASAQQPPPAPQTRLEWGAANEAGERTLYLLFHAEAGVRYWAQQANGEDYNASTSTGFPWHTVGSSIYGLGQDVRVPVYTLTPPPVDPDEPTGDQWSYALPSVSMRLCPLADGSGVMVGWASGYLDYTRQFFPSSSVSGLPDSGYLHTEEMNFLWYKGEEVSAADPQVLARPLTPEQAWQWPLIQAALPTILAGTGGVTEIPTSTGTNMSGSAKSRFWQLQLAYPDSDGDGIPDWLEAKGFVNGAGVRMTSDPFTTDTDGDGVSDFEEWAAGTNPGDASSHPFKVLQAAPYVGEAGARLDGALIFYFNDVLPEGFTLPADCVKYVNATKDPVTNVESWSLEAVPGTSVLLPGRRSVAWLPASPLHEDDDSGPALYHVPRFNYLYSLTTANTGLTPMVAFKSKDSLLADANPDALGWVGFSTTTLTDTIGPAVLQVSPGLNYVEVAPTTSINVRWSQPLAPATVNATNITLTKADTGEAVSATLSFNYGLELVTPHPDYDPNTHEWRAANTLTLTPGAALQPDTLYTVTLGTGCANLMGKPLLHSYTWNFRTRPAPATITEGAGPHVTSMLPAAYSTNVSVASLNGVPIALNFSGAVNAATLTTDTVHVRRRGISTDEDVTLSYNSSAHRLDILLNNGAVANTRYEITLDAANIYTPDFPILALQGDTKFVFTTQTSTAPPMSVTPVHPLGGGSGPSGGGPAGGGGSPDPEEPPALQLTVDIGDADAGEYAEITIISPEGSERMFQTETVTDDYRTIDLPEVPHGYRIIAAPGFTKGSDKNTDNHEESEIALRLAAKQRADNGVDSATADGVFLEDETGVHFKGMISNISVWAYYQRTTGAVREKIRVVPMDILPVPADTPKLGMMVKSIDRKKHDNFVGPKKNADLNDPYVTFEVPLRQDEWQDIEWGPGGEQGNADNQQKVDRTDAGKTVLSLRTKSDQTELTRTPVWMVWGKVAAGYPKITSTKTFNEYDHNGSTFLTPKINGMAVVFDVEPKALFEDFNAGKDAPDLKNPPKSPPPFTDIGVQEKFHGRYEDIPTRFVMGQQMRIKHKDFPGTPLVGNDDLIPEPIFEAKKLAAAGLPKADVEIVPYPGTHTESNDYTYNGPYDQDPYSSSNSFSPERDGSPITPAIGQVGAGDKPDAPDIRVSVGPADQEVQHWHQWKTHVRLGLDDKNGTTQWYIISDDAPWERIVKFKKRSLDGGPYKMTDFETSVNFFHSTGY